MAEIQETTINPEEVASGTYLDDLLPALQRLDRLLERAIASADAAYGTGAGADPFRGLHISPEETASLLSRSPGAPLLYTDTADDVLTLDMLPADSRLAWLAITFDLSPFDLDLLILALAPELDRRYERLYAYLQDHVARRRPSVDLALHLLCPDAAARLERRAHFDGAAPLIRHGLIHLIPENDHDHPSLLAHTLKLDDQIVRLLLRQDGMDRRLMPFCISVVASEFLDDLPLDGATKRALPALFNRSGEDAIPLRLYFHGPHGSGKRAAAAAAAAEAGCSLLAVDLTGALAADVGFVRGVRLALHHAAFEGAIPYLENLDALHATDQEPVYRQLLDILQDETGPVILAGVGPWTSAYELVPIDVSFGVPDFAQRRVCWQNALDQAGVELAPTALDALVGRFRLLPSQIVASVADAVGRVRWRLALDADAETSDEQPTLAELYAAARAQSSHDLASLTRKIEPVYSENDIVLPDDSMDQLREICQRVTYRERVLGEWCFGRKLSLGRGVTALFAGPSGTGKTMAAEIIAGNLGLDLYKIDLSGIVSKYIGETEKNLDRVFTAAEGANAILLFDEADALFGKRSEVRDSHDRYANIEISYLLQKMEEYDGIAILATNLRQNLDDSFVRRLTSTIFFPFPDEDSRRRIWAVVWPAEAPLAGDIDFDYLARQYALSGGNIKNIALAAAFLAANDGAAVTMTHLLRATRREYQKMGKVLSEADLSRNSRGATL